MIAWAAKKASIEDLVAIYVEVHGDGGEQMTVHVAQHLTLAPSIVKMTNRDHVPLARLELILDAVLHLFAFWFSAIGNHKTWAHKKSRIAEALARAEPIEVRFFFLDLNAAHRVDTKPGREGKSILIGPVANGWQRNSLNIMIILFY